MSAYVGPRLSVPPRKRIICFSHLRWNFVFQRPQHLLTRAARTYHVTYVEEPVRGNTIALQVSRAPESDAIDVITPVLPDGVEGHEAPTAVRDLLNHHLKADDQPPVFWYYTPAALSWHNNPSVALTIYDCMDELAAFKGAPPSLRAQERDLFTRCDLVFCGGRSLYEAKREYHYDVHCFPSSIDVAHFRKARLQNSLPADAAAIPGMRIGFFGVIDERMDLELIARIARARPDWSLIMIGPVVKISEADLPRAPNIYWLGGRDYKQLPSYIGSWSAGLMPFALNDSTRYISPTKTPEFLAAGCPVVSTPIKDVIDPYGRLGLVEIARTPDEIVAAIDQILTRPREPWIAAVDQFLAGSSWDDTWQAMDNLITRRTNELHLASRAHRMAGEARV